MQLLRPVITNEIEVLTLLADNGKDKTIYIRPSIIREFCKIKPVKTK